MWSNANLSDPWALYNTMQLQVDLCPFKVIRTQFSSKVLGDQHSLNGTLSQPLSKPDMDKTMDFPHISPHNNLWKNMNGLIWEPVRCTVLN